MPDPEPRKRHPACAESAEPTPIPAESSSIPRPVAHGQAESSAGATQETTAPPEPESPAWQAALALLCQRISEDKINGCIKPIHAMQDGDILRLDCEDDLFKQWIVDNYDEEINRALKETGFNGTYIYSVGLWKQKTENAVQQQENARKNEKFRANMNELAQKDWREQFKAFVRLYPQKGLPAGLGRVEKLFGRLHRKGLLPPVDVLFSVLATLKHSKQWTKDGDKYIIGIEKFLRNAPWNDYELWSGAFV